MAIESNEVWYENMFLKIINSMQILVVFWKYHTTKLIVLITSPPTKKKLLIFLFWFSPA